MRMRKMHAEIPGSNLGISGDLAREMAGVCGRTPQMSHLIV
jgi:hypothetical protein